MNFTKYKIKKEWSLNHRYVVTDESGELVAEAKTNIWSARFRTLLYDSFGDPVLTIRRKIFSFNHTFFIDIDGVPKYRIQKTWSFRPKIFVDALDETDAFLVEGDIWGSEYAFYRSGEEFAYVSKKMWSLNAHYGLAVSDEVDHMPVIALVIVLNLIKRAQAQAG